MSFDLILGKDAIIKRYVQIEDLEHIKFVIKCKPSN